MKPKTSPSEGLSDADLATLTAIRDHFHDVIRGRILGTPAILPRTLPDLDDLLRSRRRLRWLPVEMMTGGFSYRLRGGGPEMKLVVESWQRICPGSGERHEITARGAVLVAEGFC